MVLAVLAAAPARAQYVSGTTFLPPGPARAELHAPVAAAGLPQVPAPQAQRRSTSRILAHVVGGSLVGAWVGLVTSQVMKSDWEKISNTDDLGYRLGFAAGGAAIGGGSGFVVGVRPGPPVQRATILDVERNAISGYHARTSGAQNAYELVSSLRPHWLRRRGNKSFREDDKVEGTTVIVVHEGIESIIVYMDNARMGGIESLRQIPISAVGGVRFYDGPTASYMWGSGHAHGVILVSSPRGL